MPQTATTRPADSRIGLAYGLAAYTWWGFVPVYFHAVGHVPALEVLAHRVIWSVVLLSLAIARLRLFPELRHAVRTPALLRTLAMTTGLIAVNWFVYIYAVGTGQILEGSLGYFINPLVNVVLGVVFLGERLTSWKWASVALAVAGVALMTARVGRVPLIALVLAGSFGLYGLMRKRAPVGALVGLAVETALLVPLGLAYVAWAESTGHASFGTVSRGTDLLLLVSGIVTAVPLLWFAGAARRVRLSTLGFLQYIAPTLQFLLAVFVYGEPIDTVRVVAFAFIWVGLIVFAAGTLRQVRAAGGGAAS